MPSSTSVRSADLTRDAVIEVALGIADAEGLDTLTVRRLATSFGVTPMALYWHVKNKEELLDAMGDAVYAAMRLPALDDRDPMEQYGEVLEAALEGLRAHPGAVQLAAGRVLYNEAGRDLTERALLLLRQAGLSVQASADIARSSLQTMTMLVSAEPGVERGATAAQRAALLAAKAAALRALPAERYPNLVECATALIDCDDRAVYYREGLALFLAGVRARASEGSGSTPPRRRRRGGPDPRES